MTQRNEHNRLPKQYLIKDRNRFNPFNLAVINAILMSSLKKKENDLQRELQEKQQIKEIEENKLADTSCSIQKWTNIKNQFIKDKIYFLLCIAEPHKHPNRTTSDIEDYKKLIPTYDDRIIKCVKIIESHTKQKPILEERLNTLIKEITDIENQLIITRDRIDFYNQILKKRSHQNVYQNRESRPSRSDNEQEPSCTQTPLNGMQTHFKRHP